MTAPGTTAEKRIVVGVDGSASSRLALRQADELAAERGATLDVIATWTYPTTFGLPMLPTVFSLQLPMEQMLAAAVQEELKPERAALAHQKVLEGNPAHVLTDLSKGAQLLVVGRRGHGGFAGLRLGSVSSAVLAHAQCPVLVMPEVVDQATEADATEPDVAG